MRFGMSSSNSTAGGADVDRPVEPESATRHRDGAGRSSQAALRTATRVVGRKWHPVVVHRILAAGPLGFNELKRDLDPISGKVLSECLSDLTDWGLVEREVIEDRPVRVSYSATPAGRDLRPVLAAMADWGREHGPHPGADDE